MKQLNPSFLTGERKEWLTEEIKTEAGIFMAIHTCVVCMVAKRISDDSDEAIYPVTRTSGMDTYHHFTPDGNVTMCEKKIKW